MTTKSIAERAVVVRCAPPKRAREDDKTVELFLSAWQAGRFAKNPEWLPQHVRNIEVIGTASSGVRLGVEHTRIHSFPDHQNQESLLRLLARHLESNKLDVTDRQFEVFFHSGFFKNFRRPTYEGYAKALSAWLNIELPKLSMCDTPVKVRVPSLLPGGDPGMEIAAIVSRRIEGLPAISVRGWLPGTSRQRIEPLLAGALKGKVPKLAAAPAEVKVLLLELATTDVSFTEVIDVVQELQVSNPLVKSIDHIVLAKMFDVNTSPEGWFFIYEPLTFKMSEVIHVIPN